MIDILITIVKQLIDLVKEKRVSKRNLFEDHINPIYTNLRLIIDDYRDIFIHVRRKLHDQTIPIHSIIDELTERRTKNSLLREEIKAYSEILKHSKNLEIINDFCWACWNLFNKEPTLEAPPDRPKPNLSLCISLLNDFEVLSEYDPDEKEVSRTQYIEITDMYLNTINLSWQDIMEEYYQLRTKLLK